MYAVYFSCLVFEINVLINQSINQSIPDAIATPRDCGCVIVCDVASCVCAHAWSSFCFFTLPALPLADLAADGPPALSQRVQLLLQQGAVGRGQLADDLLPGAGQRGHGGLVADQALLQFLPQEEVRFRKSSAIEPVAPGEPGLSSD